MSTTLPLVRPDNNHSALLAASTWVQAVEGLDEFAAELFEANRPLRLATQARLPEVLRADASRDVSRALAVGFELFVQSIALALDLRGASKEHGLAVGRWIVERTAGMRGARRRLLEGALDPDERAVRMAERATGEEDPLQAALARRLRICAETLGPTFVKFGQILGSSTGLLPPEFVSEFGRCRDEVRPERVSAIKREIENALGPLATTFTHFDDVPIASASIAQVHSAELLDGTPVVVKVQRPGIRTRMERDAALLHRFARAADQIDLVETANLPGIIELFTSCVLEELDFRLEAENMIEFALCLEHARIKDVAIPRPIPGLVTPTVLVMERLDGRPITNLAYEGVGEAEALGVFRVGTQAVLEGALTYGLFHADLHAGNILALADGRFGLVDFGIVGRFDARQRDGLARWMLSFTSEEISTQLDALADLGAFPDEIDLAAAEDQIKTAIARVETLEAPNLEEIASHFELIARILAHHGMRLPKELALFFKNLIHVSGAVRVLAPERNPYAEVGELLSAVEAKYA